MSPRRFTEARRSRSARCRFSCVNLAHDSGVEALRVCSGRAPRSVGAPANGPCSHQAYPAPPHPRVLGAPAQTTTPSSSAASRPRSPYVPRISCDHYPSSAQRPSAPPGASLCLLRPPGLRYDGRGPSAPTGRVWSCRSVVRVWCLCTLLAGIPPSLGPASPCSPDHSGELYGAGHLDRGPNRCP